MNWGNDSLVNLGLMKMPECRCTLLIWFQLYQFSFINLIKEEKTILIVDYYTVKPCLKIQGPKRADVLRNRIKWNRIFLRDSSKHLRFHIKVFKVEKLQIIQNINLILVLLQKCF